MPGFGRFKDEIYKDMVHIVDNGTLPEHLTNQAATEDHYFHLTVTRQKRDELQRYVASYILSLLRKGGAFNLVKNELYTMDGDMVLVCS